jgi:hypothetical protein
VTSPTLRKPTIAWLSFSPDEIERACALVRALDGEGVLDELGFGPLQGAFADRFYPATSTIQTRCRYVFFVGSVYRYIERARRTSDREVDERVRGMLSQLCAVLDGNEKLGVIGSRSGGEVKRVPSNVYWAALQQLGIFRWRMSERSYQQEIAGSARRAAVRDDDKRVLGSAGSDSAWDTTAPIADLRETGDKFPADTSFRLTRPEAASLRARIDELDRQRVHGPSLTAHLVALGSEWTPDSLDAPWSAPRLPPGLREAVQHAEALSLLARGIILQYHVMLIDARASKGWASPDVGLRDKFVEWFPKARARLAAWDLDALGVLPFVSEVTRVLEDLAFLRSWLTLLLESSDARKLLDDRRARELIRVREFQKRPRKARLRNERFLKDWRPRARYEGLHELHYRHRVGGDMARDIVRGLAERA